MQVPRTYAESQEISSEVISELLLTISLLSVDERFFDQIKILHDFLACSVIVNYVKLIVVLAWVM